MIHGDTANAPNVSLHDERGHPTLDDQLGGLGPSASTPKDRAIRKAACWAINTDAMPCTSLMPEGSAFPVMAWQEDTALSRGNTGSAAGAPWSTLLDATSSSIFAKRQRTVRVLPTIQCWTRTTASLARKRIKHLARGGGLATSLLRPLPDFLIIGAKWGGTTSLHFDLLEHPAVMYLYPPPVPMLKTM